MSTGLRNRKAPGRAQAPVCNADRDDNPPPQQPPPGDKIRNVPGPGAWNDRSVCSKSAWISQRRKNVHQIADHALTSPDNIGRDLIAYRHNDPKPEVRLAVFGHANREQFSSGVQQVQAARALQPEQEREQEHRLQNVIGRGAQLPHFLD
jgi:hypothetical protein